MPRFQVVTRANFVNLGDSFVTIRTSGRRIRFAEVAGDVGFGDGFEAGGRPERVAVLVDELARTPSRKSWPFRILQPIRYSLTRAPSMSVSAPRRRPARVSFSEVGDILRMVAA